MGSFSEGNSAWCEGGAGEQHPSPLQQASFYSWLQSSGEELLSHSNAKVALEKHSPRENLAPWSKDVPGYMAWDEDP